MNELIQLAEKFRQTAGNSEVIFASAALYAIAAAIEEGKTREFAASLLQTLTGNDEVLRKAATLGSVGRLFMMSRLADCTVPAQLFIRASG